MTTSSVKLVLSASLDRHLFRALNSRLDPMRGTLFLPVQRRYKVDDANRFIIEKLGKVAGPLPKRRRSGRLGALVRAWLTAEEVRLLVVGSSEFLSTRVISNLADHASAIGADIWFVYGGEILSALHRNCFNDLEAQRRSAQDLFELVRGESHREPPASTGRKEQRRLGAVPDDEWPAFASACEQQLHPADARLALSAYRHSAQTLAEEMNDFPGDVGRAAKAVRDLLTTRATRAELLALLRGAQVSAMFADTCVRVNPTTFFAGPATTLETVTPDVARALRSSTSFKAPAAYVVAYVSNAETSSIVSVTTGDVCPDASEVRVAGKLHAVPTLLRPSLRALLELRKQEGATNSSPLFAQDKDRESPIAVRTLRREFGELAAHTGIQAEVERHIDASSDDEDWLRRRGITVKPLWPVGSRRGMRPGEDVDEEEAAA